MGFYPKGEVSDGDYILRRAEMEAEIAAQAAAPAAAEVHHKLADAYLGVLFGDQEEQAALPLARSGDEAQQVIRQLFRFFGAAIHEDQAAPSPPEFKDLLSKLDE